MVKIPVFWMWRYFRIPLVFTDTTLSKQAFFTGLQPQKQIHTHHFSKHKVFYSIAISLCAAIGRVHWHKAVQQLLNLSYDAKRVNWWKITRLFQCVCEPLGPGFWFLLSNWRGNNIVAFWPVLRSTFFQCLKHVRWKCLSSQNILYQNTVVS